MSEREEYITGLRQFADWLTLNPQVRAPGSQRLLLALHTNTAVVEFAESMGLEVRYDAEGNASSDITFGPLVFHAYGYVDFTAHCEAEDEQRARQWAERKGLELRPASFAPCHPTPGELAEQRHQVDPLDQAYAALAPRTLPDPIAYGPTGYRCGCGKDAHSNLAPCQPDEPSSSST